MMLKHFVKTNRDISGEFIQRHPNFSHGRRRSEADFQQVLEKLLETRGPGPFTILEVGGIDRPRLKKDPRYCYVGLDVDANENCSKIYDAFYVQSVEESIPVRADLIISKSVLEHVPDVRAAFQCMYECLNEGGEMLHLLPGGYHPYSLATKLVGHQWQKKLIGLIMSPGAAQRLGYIAYYNLCSFRQMKSLAGSLHPEKITITPYWDGVGYFKFLFPLFLSIAAFNRTCEALRLTQLASHLVVYFKKQQRISS